MVDNSLGQASDYARLRVIACLDKRPMLALSCQVQDKESVVHFVLGGHCQTKTISNRIRGGSGMSDKTRLLLKIIGTLSLISGIYLFVIGSEFLDYFFALFLGIVLLGSAFLDKSETGEG
jgi:hypothetical protein